MQNLLTEPGRRPIITAVAGAAFHTPLVGAAYGSPMQTILPAAGPYCDILPDRVALCRTRSNNHPASFLSNTAIE